MADGPAFSDQRVAAILQRLDASVIDLLANFERLYGSREAALAKLRQSLEAQFADEWNAVKRLAERTGNGR